eukprot:418476_1
MFLTSCIALTMATWNNTNLFNLTYSPGCIPSGWEAFFTDDQVKQEVLKISQTISQQPNVDNYNMMPLINHTFRALYMTPLSQLKSVIIGQDPAPEYGMASGLAFSIPSIYDSSKVPSIQRVLLEVQNSKIPVNISNGDITSWANNGVLLLNAALTIACENGENWCEIGSHLDLWRNFTELLVKYININAKPSVFILWGYNAKQFGKYINISKHLILEGGHPSPNADGAKFFCLNYFNCANQWLVEQKRATVIWDLFDSIQDDRVCNWGWHSRNKTSYCFEECAQKGCYRTYSLIDEKVTWDTAKILCGRDGLASINSEKDQHIVANLCDGNSCWVGLKYYDEWEWVWDDYKQFNYINWAPGQPTNIKKKRCGYLMGNKHKKWKNHMCDMKFYAVCNSNTDAVSVAFAKNLIDKINHVEKEMNKMENVYEKLVYAGYCLVVVVVLVCCYLKNRKGTYSYDPVKINPVEDV